MSTVATTEERVLKSVLYCGVLEFDMLKKLLIDLISIDSLHEKKKSVTPTALEHAVYSYFEKGCRKKCTRQSRNWVLSVVLSALFFKEI